jgi:hypothetical protein
MKSKLYEKLAELSAEHLVDIINGLCEKNKALENEIEFLLNPKKIKYPQSYYNRFVKKMIDTNSWSKFPNKGVKGLIECMNKVKQFDKSQNFPEAIKLSLSIQNIILRCKKNYNSHNVVELNDILKQLYRYL